MSNGGDNGDGEGGGTKDTASCAMTGERGMTMVCVCCCVYGETTKNKVGRKKGLAIWHGKNGFIKALTLGWSS